MFPPIPQMPSGAADRDHSRQAGSPATARETLGFPSDTDGGGKLIAVRLITLPAILLAPTMLPPTVAMCTEAEGPPTHHWYYVRSLYGCGSANWTRTRGQAELLVDAADQPLAEAVHVVAPRGEDTPAVADGYDLVERVLRLCTGADLVGIALQGKGERREGLAAFLARSGMPLDRVESCLVLLGRLEAQQAGPVDPASPPL